MALDVVRVRMELGRLNRTKAWLARKLGIPAPTLSRYLGGSRGKTGLPGKVLRGMEEALGLKVGELETKKGAPSGVPAGRGPAERE